MKPILPLFTGYFLQQRLSDHGIILPDQQKLHRAPCIVQIAHIDQEYGELHDIRPKDICIFERGALPYRKSPEGSGVQFMQVSALVAVVQRAGEPYIRMLNGHALVKVNYDKSRIISSISENFLYNPSDDNRDEAINECVIAYLPNEAVKYPELKEGRRCWAHHAIAEEKNIFTIGEEQYSRINWNSLFIVENEQGEIIPVGDNILFKKSGKEKVEEMLSSGLTLVRDEKKINKERSRGELVSAPTGHKFNEYRGKDFIFHPNVDYPVKIKGERYFKVYERMIMGVCL